MKIVEIAFLDVQISRVEHSRFISRFKADYTHIEGGDSYSHRGPTLLRTRCSDAPLVYIKRK